MNKYGAKKTMVDGIKFDSKREARRYGELIYLERLGDITELKVHPAFDLVVNEIFIGRYTGDFGYRNAHGYVVEDVKSPATAKRADYQLRKRLMSAIFGIDIVEMF